MSVLLYKPGQPLEEVESIKGHVPVGTLKCHSWKYSPSEWYMRTKRRSGGHIWKLVPKAQVPKAIKAWALILNIPIYY